MKYIKKKFPPGWKISQRWSALNHFDKKIHVEKENCVLEDEIHPSFNNTF